jgi:hypothetical protein
MWNNGGRIMIGEIRSTVKETYLSDFIMQVFQGFVYVVIPDQKYHNMGLTPRGYGATNTSSSSCVFGHQHRAGMEVFRQIGEKSHCV